MRKESQASILENHIYIPSSPSPSNPAPMITLRERGGPYGFLISFFFCFDRKKQGTADNYYPLLVNHRWEMCFSTPFIIFSSSSSPSSPLR